MSSKEFETVSSSVEQTIELGRKLGKQFQGGEIIALVGHLGTGKTHLIKGIALGLKVENNDEVTSPTFTLINEYEGKLPLYHIDAYRLDNPQQLEAIGFDEICAPPMVVVVEWADRVQTLIESYSPIWIHLEHRGETERYIRISNIPETMNL